MDKIIPVLLLLILVSCSTSKKITAHLDAKFYCIEIKGSYQDRNLYVQNPQLNDDYCAVVVYVNNKELYALGTLKFGAFEVDLGSLDLEMDDPLKIQIYHHKGCKPKVLNPEILYPRMKN
ncbi:MAG: hypothetical protein HRT57_09300 [Crocinitomicaceae bacterium]|nr:hypothetical protein [Crocinitomicaceae bacterium]